MTMQHLVSVAWPYGSSRQSHGSAVITRGCVNLRAVAQRQKGVTVIEIDAMIYVDSSGDCGRALAFRAIFE